MSYIRGLGDQDQPDYKYLRNLTASFAAKVSSMTMCSIREFERLSHVNQQRLVRRTNVVEQNTPRDRAGRRDRNRMRRTRPTE